MRGRHSDRVDRVIYPLHPRLPTRRSCSNASCRGKRPAAGALPRLPWYRPVLSPSHRHRVAQPQPPREKLQAATNHRGRLYCVAKRFRLELHSRIVSRKRTGSKTLGIIVEKPLIRKNYLAILSKPGSYGLQSRPSPDRTQGKYDALVAQMDRVLASEAKGRAFESRRVRQSVTVVNPRLPPVRLAEFGRRSRTDATLGPG